MSAPTVFFIDDSATMREVIKIAFRRENIEVVACHDGDAAIAQMQQQHPDVVISDVIMPGKDGYEVCQQIKQTPGFGNTPVVLMSGVVNRNVAEKAFAVKADELIRKPFQPQDLIARVKQLLESKKNVPAAAPAPVVAAPMPPVARSADGRTCSRKWKWAGSSGDDAERHLLCSSATACARTRVCECSDSRGSCGGRACARGTGSSHSIATGANSNLIEQRYRQTTHRSYASGKSGEEVTF